MNRTSIAILVSAALCAPAYAATLPSDVKLAKEQHLVRGNGAEPSTLDPTFVNSGMPGDIIANDMFEGLVIENSQGQVIPGQATQWTVSDDGLTYTFNLRKGAQWSNGEPVTANDFVFAWQRAVNPKTGNNTGHYFVTANIANAKAIQEGEKQPQALGIKAIDADTLEITLAKPTPYLLSLLSVKTFSRYRKRQLKSMQTLGPNQRISSPTAHTSWLSGCRTSTLKSSATPSIGTIAKR